MIGHIVYVHIPYAGAYNGEHVGSQDLKPEKTVQVLRRMWVCIHRANWLEEVFFLSVFTSFIQALSFYWFSLSCYLSSWQELEQWSLQKSAGALDSLMGAHEHHENYVFFSSTPLQYRGKRFYCDLTIEWSVPPNSENISHKQLILVLRLFCVEFSHLWHLICTSKLSFQSWCYHVFLGHSQSGSHPNLKLHDLVFGIPIVKYFPKLWFPCIKF